MTNRRPVVYAEPSEVSPNLKPGELTDNLDGTWSVNASGESTGKLRPPAGSTAPDSAPLKLTPGPLMTTPEPGALEFEGTTFRATADGVRGGIDLTVLSIVTDVVVANTTTETEIVSNTFDADYFTPGKFAEMKFLGTYSTRNSSDTLTVRLKANGVTLATLVTPGKNVTNTPTIFNVYLTTHDMGPTANAHQYLEFRGDGAPSVNIATASTSVDTTTTQTISLTVQWSHADVGNSLTLEAGTATCKF